ncbi:MAG: hypothetical protein JRD88_00610, partial [Deltaproteobacteria bacterium]|nr:hypothetical protein [Deltaproteobacteria bacterium]
MKFTIVLVLASMVFFQSTLANAVEHGTREKNVAVEKQEQIYGSQMMSEQERVEY